MSHMVWYQPRCLWTAHKSQSTCKYTVYLSQRPKAPDLCYMLLLSDLVELIFKRSDTLTDIRTDFATILTPGKANACSVILLLCPLHRLGSFSIHRFYPLCWYFVWIAANCQIIFRLSFVGKGIDLRLRNRLMAFAIGAQKSKLPWYLEKISATIALRPNEKLISDLTSIFDPVSFLLLWTRHMGYALQEGFYV